MGSDNSAKIRLMVIDDEEGVLRAFELMLKAFGFEVHPFSEPKVALEALSEIKPDWIISDLRMPEIDGFGILEARNEHHPNIPLILISGHAKEPEIKKAEALGAQAVLQKPFDPALLMSIIKQASASQLKAG